MSHFEADLMKEDAILAEGAVIERLRMRGALPGRQTLAASLVFEEGGRQALGEIFRSYIDAAADTGMMIVILASPPSISSWPRPSRRLKRPRESRWPQQAQALLSS